MATNIYFDTCVKDQSLIFIFIFSFCFGALITAILILCLRSQFRSLIEHLFFQKTTIIYEFVNVKQLNGTNRLNASLSKPSKRIKFLKDVFGPNEDSVKHINIKDLIESSVDPGLPPVLYEAYEKESLKNQTKINSKRKSNLKTIKKLKRVEPQSKMEQIKRIDV